MFGQLERYIPVFEAYLSSNKKQQFILSLKDPQQKAFLQLLTSPISNFQAFKIKIKNIGNFYGLKESLILYKLSEFIKNSNELKDDQIGLEIKRRFQIQNFNYTRPPIINNQSQVVHIDDKSVQQVKIDDNLQLFLSNKLTERPSNISQFSDYAISKLKQQQILQLPLAQKQYLLDKCGIIFHFDHKFISKLLIAFQNEKRKTNENYRLTSKILGSLTRNQLVELGNSNPNMFNNEDYIELWFNQLYSQRISKAIEGSEYFSTSQHLQKRDKFNEMIKELSAKSQHLIIKSYINKLNIEVLILDVYVNDPSIDRLIQFLSTSSTVLKIGNIKRQYSQQIKENYKKSNIKQPKMRFQLQVDQLTPQKIVQDYIQALFTINANNEQSIKRLTRFYQQIYLRKLNAKIRLFKGQNIENLNDYFNQSEIQTLRQKRQIKLLRSNNRKFKIEDDVSLQINVKNVKNIDIKIYQLNLEKHHLNNSSEIDDQINLSFLLPTHQLKYVTEYKSPFQVKKAEIDLKDHIPKAMGVYFVDLQGQTVTSRAIIRKGKIICIDDQNQAGQKFSFYDQNGKPLTKENGLKIWIKKKQIQLEDNSILLKYQDSTRYETIVASVGSFAQSFLKSFVAQQYQFDIGYLYNAQSFIVGKKAKIILHPKLRLNKNVMSVQLLKNTTVKVNVTNNQKIKTFYSFNIPSWSNYTDQVIEFPIQSYIQNINIVLEAQILLQNGKIKQLVHNKDISIDLGQSNQNFLEFYLEKNSKNQYVLNLLGLNGQKMSNIQANISYLINGFDTLQKKVMKFNQHGQINLGELRIVSKLQAHIYNQGAHLQKSWQIDQTQSSFNYNKTIYHKVGQQLALPINSNWKIQDIVFLRTFDKYYANDQSHTLKIENGILKLPIIKQQGFYILKFLPIDKTIEIVTLKNIKWQGDNQQNQKVYDQDAGKVYEIKKNTFQSIRIQNVEFKAAQNHTKAKLSLDLSGIGQQKKKFVRVHVYANNYHSSQFLNAFDPSTYTFQSKFKEHRIDIKRSSYYSNKTLSQQGSYVWNRQKKEEKLIGNNLQKPSMFLKRIFVRQTQQTEEQLQQSDDFQQECAFIQMDPNMRNRLQAKKAQEKLVVMAPSNINSHNNFLGLTGEVQTNLKGESNIQIQIPLGYNSIQVIVTTPSSSIKKTFSLGSDLERSTINLTHSGLQQTKQNKGWTMSRQIYKIRSGQQQNVSRNSQWRAVSLSQVFDFAHTKKIKLYDWSSHLLNWHTYSFDKKKQIYDKECCHQLNTFIKFKDPLFFKDVVSNFIRNKIIKTVVDLCLLQDKSVINYIKINQFNQLNAFQKVLLVYSLLKHNNQELKNVSRNIVQALELQQKSNKRNYEIFKNNFDTIINAKETQELKVMKKTANNQYAKKKMMMQAMDMPGMQQQVRSSYQEHSMRRRQVQADKKKAFVPVESTKQYTQRTYYNVKNYKSEAPSLISASPFWSELSRFILQGNQANFLSQSFMYFSKPIDFILSASFISSQNSSNFQLSNSGENYKIKTKVPLLIYVKQVKQLQYAKKYAVLINQRFFDPSNRVSYEQDGTEIQKQAQQFILKKPYVCQTVINNTSGTPLELQVLLDIPKGTIPLASHQYTQIVNISISPYTSQKFQRFFYAPKQGRYPIYPSNASKGSLIIAKGSNLPQIIVGKTYKNNKLESFGDVLRSGDLQLIIQFIKQKNIFDRNIFNVSEIFWMLKDKEFYAKVIKILRQRNFYDYNLWNFGFLHGDMEAIREIINFKTKGNLQAAVFQYFPYYSSRTHQFANQNKSTIRNVQFKETYIKFLLYSVINIQQKSAFNASYAYYLILQDRLKQAQQILSGLNAQQYSKHQIQFDYMKCFLDLSLNAPNFNDARQIIKKYKNYPLQSWAKLFEQVRKTIETQDEQIFDSSQNNIIQQFQTQIIQQIGQFKVIKPAETQIVIQLFELNLELYFSQFPFQQLTSFTSVKPSRVTVLKATDKTQQVVIKRSDYQNLKDVNVQIRAYKAGTQAKKVSSFSWNNPDIKVKVNENLGSLQVFINKKRAAGSYIKVFTQKNYKKQFYRDGYTDMTGTFRYAMSDLQGITQFSILISTDVGGVVQKVKPPSKLASY